MSFAQEIQQAGLRATPARIRIVTWLANHQEPVAASEIAKYDRSISRMTVFRMLEDLIDHGLVQEIRSIDGTRKIEYIGSRPHHHHFSCEDCGRIEHLPLKLEQKMVASLQRSKGFRITRHSMEFSGKCKNCLKKGEL